MFRVSRIDKFRKELFLFRQLHIRIYVRKRKITLFVLKNNGVVYVYNL